MGFNRFTLSNSKGESITVDASAGATLISYQKLIQDKLEEMIAIPEGNSYELIENPYHPSSFLFPFQNRVRNGNYSFRGKNYQLEINEANLNNAIHGFIDRSHFTNYEIDHQSIRLSFDYLGEKPGYPFPFQFEVKYVLEENGELGIFIQVMNTGSEPMPFSFGWHPYFQWKGLPPENLSIQFQPKEKYLSDSQMIPLESIELNNKEIFDFSKEKLDHIFLLRSEKEWHEIALYETKNPNQKMILTFPKQDFSYSCVFIPNKENSLALEPLTGNTDCFNTEEGLRILMPRELFKTSIFCKFNL